MLAAPSALAEKADRSKPMIIEADQPGSVDLQRQVVTFNGNVVISQGTMLLRAERVELRERPDGYREAKAFGSAEHPATFSQSATALPKPSKARPSASSSTRAPTRCAWPAMRRCAACAVAWSPTRSPAR